MPKVEAYVYDITQGFAAGMSMMLLGKQIDYVPHTGIVVFGKEYYFGSGPCDGPPGDCVGIPTTEILDLGNTEKTQEELESHISAVLATEYTPEKYELLSHNCNHYADAIAKFLLKGTGVPARIVNIADEALSTPQGQNIRVMIEEMDKNMRDGMSGQSSLNPFGGAPPAARPGSPRSGSPRSGSPKPLQRLPASPRSGSPRSGSPKPLQRIPASPRSGSPKPASPKLASPRSGSPKAARSGSPKPAPKEAAAVSAPSPAGCLSLADLKNKDVCKARGVDMGKREEYLSDADFLATFGMAKADFAKMPAWKKDKPKKEFGLF